LTDGAPISIPDDFEQEFPGASRSAAVVAPNLVRTAALLITEIERRSRETADLSVSAFQTLAILDGADGPLTAHAIAEQLLVSSASMTSLLDTLERRGLIERQRHPTDRRMVQIHLTEQARRIVDQVLPAIHATITSALTGVGEPEREQLVTSLASIQAQVETLASQPPPVAPARRNRRARRATGR
jgi:DNA-binding MarR family transcriptional regulator